jgi:hypothetical protein
VAVKDDSPTAHQEEFGLGLAQLDEQVREILRKLSQALRHTRRFRPATRRVERLGAFEISNKQMNAFAGNMLQLRNDKNETLLVMSEQAFKSLEPDQITAVKRHTNILYSPIDTIETYGGGSTRCMMAEVFLPQRHN